MESSALIPYPVEILLCGILVVSGQDVVNVELSITFSNFKYSSHSIEVVGQKSSPAISTLKTRYEMVIFHLGNYDLMEFGTNV